MANNQGFGGERLEDIFDPVDPPSSSANRPVPPTLAGRVAPPHNLPGAAGPAAPSPAVAAPRPVPATGMLPPPPTPPRPATPGQVDDIFSGVDQTRPMVQNPRAGVPSHAPGPQRPALTPAEAERSFPTDVERFAVAKQPPLFARRSFIIGLVTLGGLAALGAGAWVVYTSVMAGRPPAAGEPAPTAAATPLPALAPEPSPTAPIPEISATPEPVPAEVETDADHDGLTDREEALYGTNSYATDTDGDGLTDRDETKVFATDPVNPDTDNDGFQDGAEVINGYDPKGPGRIKAAPLPEE